MQLVLQAHRSSGADVVIILVTSTACGATTFYLSMWFLPAAIAQKVCTSHEIPVPAQTAGELHRVAMVTGHGRHP